MVPSDFGTLHLSPAEGAAPEVPDVWLNCVPNALAAAAAVLLSLLFLSTYLRLRPHLLDCLTKKRGVEKLEHNLQSARERNICVSVAFLVTAMAADRFGLYRPDWICALPKVWRLAATGASILGFFLLRMIFGLLFRPKRIRGDAQLALGRSILSFWVLLTPLAAATIGIFLVFRASDSAISTFLYIETALFFLWNAVRVFQILREKYPPLISFLYLCALEFLPVAALIVSAALL